MRLRMPGDIEWTSGGAWLSEQIDLWERDAAFTSPIDILGRDLDISRDARLMLVAIGLVEEDGAFAELFATLQTPLGHRRPTLGLLREVTRFMPIDGVADAWSLARPLIDAGVADVLNPDAPRSEWMLRIPPPVWTAIRGERPAQPMPGLAYTPPDAVPHVDDVIVSREQRARLRQIQHLLANAPARTVVVRGTPGSERVGLVAALAASLGRGLIEATAVSSPRDEVLARIGPLS